MSGSTTLTVAWRNLGRNRRRTALALAAIGLSQAMVLFYGGIMRGYSDWMVQTITGPMLGDVQVHAPGWREDRAMDRALFGVDTMLAAIRRQTQVTRASARIYAPALAALGEQGRAVMVVGLEPAAEAGRAGLLARAEARPAGRRVLVGRPLAEAMGVEAGDTLAIVGQGADGSLANDLYVVIGLVSTPVDQMNRMGVLMDLGEAQKLFAMPDAAHEIVVHARDERDPASLARRLAALPALAGTEVLDWKTLAPQLVGLVDLIGASWAFILVFVFLAAAAGIANTMLMATFERTRELGMLLALGARPARVVGLVMSEAAVLGVAGALAGSALGAAVVLVTGRTGVDFAALASGSPSEMSYAGMNMSMIIYPGLDVGQMAIGAAAVVATALLAALWPAARAARLQPTRALRA